MHLRLASGASGERVSLATGESLEGEPFFVALGAPSALVGLVAAISLAAEPCPREEVRHFGGDIFGRDISYCGVPDGAYEDFTAMGFSIVGALLGAALTVGGVVWLADNGRPWRRRDRLRRRLRVRHERRTAVDLSVTPEGAMLSASLVF